MNSTHCKSISKSKAGDAFAFVELLVVIATVGLLAMMLLPALAKTGPNTQAFQCLNNLRQIQHGWIVYSADNNDRITPTVGEGFYQVTSKYDPYTQPGNPYNQWIYGDMTQPAAAANTDLLTVGLIFPYAPNIAFFKCPADPRTIWFGNITPLGVHNLPTVRSISMNAYLNPITNPVNTQIPPAPLNPNYRLFRKMADIAVMGAANCWAMLDESPYSINDGQFCTSAAGNTWVDKPATYHNNAGGISFADGHALIRRWTDVNLIAFQGPVPGPGGQAPALPAQPGVGDLNWLMRGASIPR